MHLFLPKGHSLFYLKNNFRRRLTMTKTKKLLVLLLSLMLIFTLSACSSQNTTGKENKSSSKVTYPLTITDSYNRKVTIDKEPQRIISVAPNITEIIFSLGMGNKLVGRTDYCDYPEQVKSIPSVGTIEAPSIEKIVELKPDVVIASTHFNKETVEKLEQLNIKVLLLYGQESFDGVYETIEKVGQVINAQDKAEKIVSTMKAKVQEIVNKVKNANKPKVYYVIGYGQYGDYTAGKGTFISQMIEMAGGTNVANDVEGWKYSIERLVEHNPDILICSKYFDSKKGIMQTNGYKDLDAVKNGKLFEIDNNLLDRQGPRLADGLEELARIIHPELFK
jgi:iron complex transport system substrate-binding protein